MEKTAEELKRCYGSWTIGFWMCSSDIFVDFDNVHDEAFTQRKLPCSTHKKAITFRFLLAVACTIWTPKVCRKR